MKFYVQVGSINGQRNYAVNANSVKEAIQKAIARYTDDGFNMVGKSVWMGTSKYNLKKVL